MVDVPFDWQMAYTGNLHGKKKCPVSKFKINAEWSLVCLWSQSNKPEYLEIRRNSTGKEILISGTLKLVHNRVSVLQRKFVQLFEAGCATALLDLDHTSTDIPVQYQFNEPLDQYNVLHFRYLNNSFHLSQPRSNQAYSISGNLTIPAGVASKENAKGVQFESLLDLSNDFERLLDSGATYFPDVNLNCGTVSLPAHKSILSARSPVFAAMFTSQMKENRENKVSITDISPNVLKNMLIYIYTGKTGELSVQSAGDLLFAADKYELLDLKKVCCFHLKSHLSVENVLNTLVLGYLHDADLKAFAMDFICNYCEEFQTLEKTAEWKNLRQKRPDLVMDVLTSLVKAKDQKLKKNRVP
ncbi:Speckle-type POZ protein-like A like protein [Argiope bruennichi]|uniref:Speckle-type POZ protein-like A like protein n=1 Tax=Argiope bruennichi TaxID=94029 RepID=A0A8T0ELW5_ARGBR|nr:Speckle-type POZ protein-like A like protein [Argiope bruennichi]